MNEHMSPIPSRLYNAAVGGHVAGANQIIDDETGLTLDKVAGGALEEKEYTSGSNNGMGRVVLRKNLVEGVNTLTQSMINKSNTIYVIQYDYTLGEDITIPENCILEFDGGSISANDSNDTITGANTSIKAGLVKIFNTNVTLAGSWNIVEAYSEWFGAKGDGITDDTNAINKALFFRILHLRTNTTYLVTDTLNIIPDDKFTVKINGTQSTLKYVPTIPYKPIIFLYELNTYAVRGIFFEGIIFDIRSEGANGVCLGLPDYDNISLYPNISDINQWKVTQDYGLGNDIRSYIMTIKIRNCTFLGNDDINQIGLTRIKCFGSIVENCNFEICGVGNVVFGCDHPMDFQIHYAGGYFGSLHIKSGFFDCGYTEVNATYGNVRIGSVWSSPQGEMRNIRVENNGNKLTFSGTATISQDGSTITFDTILPEYYRFIPIKLSNSIIGNVVVSLDAKVSNDDYSWLLSTTIATGGDNTFTYSDVVTNGGIGLFVKSYSGSLLLDGFEGYCACIIEPQRDTRYSPNIHTSLSINNWRLAPSESIKPELIICGNVLTISKNIFISNSIVHCYNHPSVCYSNGEDRKLKDCFSLIQTKTLYNWSGVIQYLENNWTIILSGGGTGVPKTEIQLIDLTNYGMPKQFALVGQARFLYDFVVPSYIDSTNYKLRTTFLLYNPEQLSGEVITSFRYNSDSYSPDIRTALTQDIFQEISLENSISGMYQKNSTPYTVLDIADNKRIYILSMKSEIFHV